MAQPKIVADFTAQLAAGVSATATSFTLSTVTDDDGVTIPNGVYYFTIDSGSSNKEYVTGTITGTSVASVSTVSRQGVETSGFARAHRAGASVKITDFATYKTYIDELTLGTAPVASTIVKGIVEEATSAEIDAGTEKGLTDAQLFINPALLAASELGKALVGNGGTLGTSNKFVTETGFGTLLATTSVPVVRVYTTSQTWTKPANLKYLTVEVQGGGGGGGRGYGNGVATGGCGGAGGYSKKNLSNAQVGATVNVTIGAGGAGSTNTSPGATGGTSSFGSEAVATGGTGGSQNGSGGAGGAGSTGDINTTGQTGLSGASVSYNSEGSSPTAALATTQSINAFGITYGAGGIGGHVNGNGSYASANGANGATGVVIVTEYFS